MERASDQPCGLSLTRERETVVADIYVTDIYCAPGGEMLRISGVTQLAAEVDRSDVVLVRQLVENRGDDPLDVVLLVAQVVGQ